MDRERTGDSPSLSIGSMNDLFLQLNCLIAAIDVWVRPSRRTASGRNRTADVAAPSVVVA